MYEYLNGTIADVGEDYVVIDINGIGFKVTTSKNTIIKIKLGDNSKLYTQLMIREDSALIYGFLSKYELELFKLLITVSGVGPKAAMSLLSSLKTEELLMAIALKNVKGLTIAQGIGKKLAERIILELKDKINLDDAIPCDISIEENDSVIQAIEALTSLGYSYTEAKGAVSKIKDNKKSVDALIKDALKQLSRI
jgi:Holliday junction DNA helicase RuvA